MHVLTLGNLTDHVVIPRYRNCMLMTCTGHQTKLTSLHSFGRYDNVHQWKGLKRAYFSKKKNQNSFSCLI